MTIQFCPICGNMQIIITKNSKQYLTCKICKTAKLCETKERIIQREQITKPKLGTGTAENNPEVGYNFKCPKCGNNKCRVIDLGIMYGDEDWIYLLQCTKCDYGERVGEMC